MDIGVGTGRERTCLVGVSIFPGLAGAGMALLTPNLISPWPTYPAIYFFAVHAGIVICMTTLVLGGGWRFRGLAVWRSFGRLLVYAAVVGSIDMASGANFMFLLRKPDAASPLDRMGAWPWYLLSGAAAGFMLFWVLWLPVRRGVDEPVPTLGGREPSDGEWRRLPASTARNPVPNCGPGRSSDQTESRWS
jgi:hypothetical integral membrane protein (TIGR02206 family)